MDISGNLVSEGAALDSSSLFCVSKSRILFSNRAMPCVSRRLRQYCRDSEIETEKAKKNRITAVIKATSAA